MRVLSCLIAAVAIAGCGGSSPSAPTPVAPPPPQLALAGTWTGSFIFTIDGTIPSASTITATLNQSPTLAVTGSFPFGSGGSVVLTGTLASVTPGALLTATLEVSTPSDQPGIFCRGATTVSGPAETTSMRLTADRMAFSNCVGAVTDVVLTLRR
jgi:hypothetical protein